MRFSVVLAEASVVLLVSSHVKAEGHAGPTSMVAKMLDSTTMISLNHLWTKQSPILALNPPYNISLTGTHADSAAMLPPPLTAVGDVMQFSGHHGAPTIDAIGHIGENATLYGGINASTVESPDGLKKLGIDEYPEDKYLNRGILLDMPYCLGNVPRLENGYEVTQDDIEACVEQLNLNILEGDSVLLRTGFGQLFESDVETYLSNQAGGGDGASKYLASLKIFLTGADNFGWDAAGLPFPSHLNFIPRNGIYIVENMNLEALAAECQRRGNWEFLLVVNPPKIKGATAMAVNSFAMFVDTEDGSLCDNPCLNGGGEVIDNGDSSATSWKSVGFASVLLAASIVCLASELF